MSENDNIQDKLLALHAAYTKTLPDKIGHIESLWQTLQSNWEQNVLDDFHREVHSLCGSSALYGYHLLSAAARELEIYLKDIPNNKTAHTAEMDKHISQLLEKLVTAR